MSNKNSLGGAEITYADIIKEQKLTSLESNVIWREGYKARAAGSHTIPYDATEQREQFTAWLAGYQSANLVIGV